RWRPWPGRHLHGGASDDPAHPPRDRPHPGEARLVRHQTPLRSLRRTLGIRVKQINALRSTVLLAIASSLVLAGCALKQPPFGADIMPESARSKIPGSWAGPHRSGAVVPNWIRNFRDPELTALVADAVERNPDLKAAAARVEASRAAVRIAASSLYPRIAMKGLGERQGQELSGDLGRSINPPDFGSSGTENSGGAGLDTSMDSSSQRWVYGIAAGAAWEADVWGRIRSKKAAAKAESAALEADYEFARQSLAAAVARAYFSTIEAAQQEANAQETLDLYQEYSKLTDVRKQQGFASDFDVSQIRSRTASAQEALYTARAARAQTIRAIEVVTSRYPAGRFDVRRSFPGQPKGVPAGLPAQILARRNKKPPLQATWVLHCARSKTWKTLWPAITICASAKARWATRFRAVPIR